MGACALQAPLQMTRRCIPWRSPWGRTSCNAGCSTCFVGSDQFIYFEKGQISQRIAPDLYVLPGVPQVADVPSWKIWESGIRPSFALEICSQNWRKDYITAPELHNQIGTEELIIV